MSRTLQERAIAHLPPELRDVYADAPLEDVACALLRELDAGRRRARPPVQSRTLAVLPRGDNHELRLELCQCAGRSYLDLRVWRRDPSGTFVHGKGAAVQPQELAAVRDAIDKALAMLAGDNDTTDPGRSPETHNGET